jgi:sugar lactone lactonase YvrE
MKQQLMAMREAFVLLALSGFVPACAAEASDASDTCANTADAVCIWAGNGTPGLNGDGHALRDSRLYWPIDVEFAPDGTAYVLDWNNHLVRQVTAAGTFQTVIGNFIGDGAEGGADATSEGVAGTEVSLNHPTDLQFQDGTIVLAAWHNHKLRRLDPQTGRVTVVAGSAPGYSGDGGPLQVTKFNQPKAIVFDRESNLYVLDQRNQRVRKIAADGIVSTVAGTGMSGAQGDGGPAQSAQLSFQTGPNPEPSGALALDAQGRLYIGDGLNYCIRRVDFDTGVIERIAGTGDEGYFGDGGDALQARIGEVRDLEFGPDGRLYVADADHHVIRAVDLESGQIDTVVGTGAEPRSGDARTEGRPALQTALNHPTGVAFDREGHLYVADSFNNRILKVSR